MQPKSYACTCILYIPDTADLLLSEKPITIKGRKRKYLRKVFIHLFVCDEGRETLSLAARLARV